MNALPLNVKLAGLSCLVVGGGHLARRKAELLDRAGARIEMVAPEFDPATRELAERRGMTLIVRRFAASDVAGRRVVVAATGDDRVNADVHRACVAAGVWVNTVDKPELCTVTFPAIIDRDPVLVAVSTSGASPALSAHLRGRIEQILPAGTGRLAVALARSRKRLKEMRPDAALRRRLVGRLIAGPFADAVGRGDDEAAERILETELNTNRPELGDVAVVGAGPGDPDLLTVKALRILQDADVVLYDNLVNPAIVDLARRDAERIYVGKKRAYAAVRQDAINQLLVEHARRGRRVVRLKGGDPFIFGRGGEEIETLVREAVPFQIVPGITAAVGCAAYAGIPLTYRDVARSVRFITGHTSQGLTNLDWPELAKTGQTLVIYMGLKGWPEIARHLMTSGRSGATPAAVVENGTLPEQRTIVATVATLADAMNDNQIAGATLIVVGEVVAFRKRFVQKS